MKDILIILAISNLITEQTIVRDIINKLFDSSNYRNFSNTKNFFYGMISCWSCFSFHCGWIYTLIIMGPSIDCIVNGLIAMLIADTINKLKR
jgi:hypothetical protein